MAVSVTGPRAANELGDPVIPGSLWAAKKYLKRLLTIDFNNCLNLTVSDCIIVKINQQK